MKRKITALILICAMIFSFSAAAFAVDKTAAIDMLGALGIMEGDQNGNLNLENNITRAEFSAMMVRSSDLKDSISADGTGFSLYKDVKSDHWASQYIRLAANRGWFNGYSDGSFKPDNNITIEEACTALIRMLGYTAKDLEGSYPYAQLNKASELGLRDEIKAVMGTKITREDALFLFCNLFKAKTPSGQVYGQTLGYTMTGGEVDYASVILQNMDGPYIAEGGESLDFTPRKVYRNGELADSFYLNCCDVYYYNESIKTVWIYTTKVSGKITALSPSESSPSTVTIGTASYSLGNASVKYQVSALGGGGTGKTVTLLLGMNGEAVGTVSGNKYTGIYYGVVNSCTSAASKTGNAKEETTVGVFCSDGVSRSFTLSGSYDYKSGKLVCVSVSGSTTGIKALSSRSISGRVSSDGKKIGDTEFADDISIIDTTDDGCGIKIEKERLAGYTVSSSCVRYYTTDEKGRITNLILKDATGDIWSYGMMLAVVGSGASAGSSLGGTMSYSFLLNGRLQALTLQGTGYYLEKGGFGIRYGLDGSVKSMKQLEEIKIDKLSAFTALSGSKEYSVDPSVSVYLKKGDNYYGISLSQINDSQYRITGYKDSSSVKADGLIRVIVAE